MKDPKRPAWPMASWQLDIKVPMQRYNEHPKQAQPCLHEAPVKGFLPEAIQDLLLELSKISQLPAFTVSGCAYLKGRFHFYPIHPDDGPYNQTLKCPWFGDSKPRKKAKMKLAPLRQEFWCCSTLSGTLNALRHEMRQSMDRIRVHSLIVLLCARIPGNHAATYRQ